MKKVTLKHLKEALSEISEQAAKGEFIEVTKYNKPFVVMGPAAPLGVRVGSKSGKGPLDSIASEATKGRLFKVLEEDRDHEI